MYHFKDWMINESCNCWKNYKRKPGTKPCAPGSCIKEEFDQIDELSRDTLLSYANKVSLDSQKHSKDPTKRSGEKASRSVTGYARAHNRLEKPIKEDKEYDEAQEHLSKANDADAKGDKKSFHAHMANHHDSMSEWHDSKGRSASADKHAEKADYHHEKSLSEEVVDEAAVDAKGYKSSTGGLTQKGRDAYNRKEGSNLKAPVTTPPSELKAGSKAANRRKSFCARMSGVDGPMKKPNGEPTRKALALRKWNC